MKWKGRPQSDMIRDLRRPEGTDPVGAIIEDDAYTGGVVPGVAKKKKKQDRLPKNPPLPTPRPKNKTTKTQVTPGKWSTK